MKKWNYKDFYGCRSTIKELVDGTYQATTTTPDGKKIRNSNHVSHKAALSALRRDTDCLEEVK